MQRSIEKLLLLKFYKNDFSVEVINKIMLLLTNDTIKKHILSIAIRNDRITPQMILDEIDLIDTIYKLENLE